MRKFGAEQSADAIAAAFQQPIEVLAGNWEAVRIYLLCKHPLAVGMAGLFTQSLPNVEIKAACEARGVPFDEKIAVMVGYLGDEVANLRNAQQGR